VRRLLKLKVPEGAPTTEWSVPFLQGMIDRMLVSFAKYGKVEQAYPAKVDAIASLKKRLEMYEETGNTEWLMDVGNFAMIEFMHPRHPEAHYRPTDSTESPGRLWNNGHQHAGANDNRDGAAFYNRRRH
jgi:hypothetical protein